MSIEELGFGFRSHLDKIGKLDINNMVRRSLLLKQMKLESQNCNSVVVTASGDYYLQSLSTSLRNAFRTKGLPAASINSNRRRYYNSAPLATSTNQGGGGKWSGARFGSQSSSLNALLFSIRMSSETANAFCNYWLSFLLLFSRQKYPRSCRAGPRKWGDEGWRQIPTRALTWSLKFTFWNVFVLSVFLIFARYWTTTNR